MSAVSETLVREYFELRGFLVSQQRKHQAPGQREEEEIDFFAFNPQPRPGEGPLPFVLEAATVARLERALVVVKGWHTEVFSPSFLAGQPAEFPFLEAPIARKAARFFGDGATVTRILVAPGLPQPLEPRDQSIALLRARGVDALLPFRTLLADLIAHTEPNRNYQKSDTLQLIRLLKNYDCLRDPQLELFKPRRRKS
jgi:hypothetical protein